ncbi:hypothetical protein EMIHUDRAFT_448219, partial [Emiliania huxleyi CCMP1516]|uniref:Tubulin--tyrosine ligase-like protein 5 n=2 Tax=Emiliania huxleyi TaxID=2903 RepID=A0A0D3IU54_EMIH1
MALRTDVTFRLAEGSSFRPLEPVGKAASSLGMRVTKGRNWSLLWSWRSPWTDAALVRPLRGSRAGAGPIVNHVGGLNELAYKSKLAVFAASLAAAHPSTFEGVAPETYILPDQLGALARRLKSEGAADAHGWPRWLSKSVKHRGVRVLPSNASEDYLRSLNAALVQRRVKPLLLRSVPRVFDLGLYVLLSSVRPLRAYLFEEALVRFGSAEYPASPAGFARQESFVIDDYSPVWKLPAFA